MTKINIIISPSETFLNVEPSENEWKQATRKVRNRPTQFEWTDARAISELAYEMVYQRVGKRMTL